ncbi:hypothetical protein HK101_003815 [Irineochytrium annulatum]|nr:hypothetical protein HK101_003815 [Irineochytrium annulatum]
MIKRRSFLSLKRRATVDSPAAQTVFVDTPVTTPLRGTSAVQPAGDAAPSGGRGTRTNLFGKSKGDAGGERKGKGLFGWLKTKRSGERVDHGVGAVVGEGGEGRRSLELERGLVANEAAIVLPEHAADVSTTKTVEVVSVEAGSVAGNDVPGGFTEIEVATTAPDATTTIEDAAFPLDVTAASSELLPAVLDDDTITTSVPLPEPATTTTVNPVDADAQSLPSASAPSQHLELSISASEAVLPTEMPSYRSFGWANQGTDTGSVVGAHSTSVGHPFERIGDKPAVAPVESKKLAVLVRTVTEGKKAGGVKGRAFTELAQEMEWEFGVWESFAAVARSESRREVPAF